MFVNEGQYVEAARSPGPSMPAGSRIGAARTAWISPVAHPHRNPKKSLAKGLGVGGPGE